MLGSIVLQVGVLCRKVMGLLTMAEVLAWRLPVPLELVQGRPSQPPPSSESEVGHLGVWFPVPRGCIVIVHYSGPWSLGRRRAGSIGQN